jgi:hypothetical protein
LTSPGSKSTETESSIQPPYQLQPVHSHNSSRTTFDLSE